MGMAITRKENTNSNIAFNSNNSGNTAGIFSTVTGNFNSQIESNFNFSYLIMVEYSIKFYCLEF